MPKDGIATVARECNPYSSYGLPQQLFTAAPPRNHPACQKPSLQTDGLRLLAEIAQGGVIEALAREGGLDSTWWAGPEMSARMKRGEVPIKDHHPCRLSRATPR
ncbi:hypothetical protein D3C81_582690 [compost metagenome]|jgi:hypothetical protein